MGVTAREAAYYTVRGVPPEVDEELRAMALRRGTSLNRLIVEELTRTALGDTPKADFSDVVGQWTPDKAFDKVIADQRRIDPAKWK